MIGWWPWPLTLTDLEPYGWPWTVMVSLEPWTMWFFSIMSNLKWRLLPRSRARGRGNNLHLRFDIIEKPHGSWFKVNHHGSRSSIRFKVSQGQRSRSPTYHTYAILLRLFAASTALHISWITFNIIHCITYISVEKDMQMITDGQ